MIKVRKTVLEEKDFDVADVIGFSTLFIGYKKRAILVDVFDGGVSIGFYGKTLIDYTIYSDKIRPDLEKLLDEREEK